PRGRHMDKHDPDSLTLLIVRRRDEKGEIEPVRERDGGKPRKPGQDPPGQFHEPRRVGQPLGERLHGTDLGCPLAWRKPLRVAGPLALLVIPTEREGPPQPRSAQSPTKQS